MGKPLLAWVGAGASSWLGYERWNQVAERFHGTFLRTEARYPRTEASHALDGERYPDVFQRCRDTNPQRYKALLADSFRPRQTTPVYERFLAALKMADRLSIVTTNIDEALERSLPEFVLVQRSDLARATSFINDHTRLSPNYMAPLAQSTPPFSPPAITRP